MRLSRDALIEKIKANVRVDSNGCWIWQKSVGSHGYGNIATGGGRNETVHRVSCEVFHGKSDLKDVLHSCDNKKCCNPEHLSWGSRRQNMIDVSVRTKRSSQKLDVDKVKYIRSCSLSTKALAEKLGVSKDLINKVRSRKAWSHVE
jgi:hypothetical protein|nr:MAG TPA: endonuclease [Caudoviricetes sp.]